MVERNVDEALFNEEKTLGSPVAYGLGALFSFMFGLMFLAMSLLIVEIFFSFNLDEPISWIFLNVSFIASLFLLGLIVLLFVVTGTMIWALVRTVRKSNLVLIFEDGFHSDVVTKKPIPSSVKIIPWKDVETIHFRREISANKVEHKIMIYLKDGSDPKKIQTEKIQQAIVQLIELVPEKLDRTVQNYIENDKELRIDYYKTARSKIKQKEKGKLLFIEDEILFIDRQFFLKRTGFWIWLGIFLYSITCVAIGIYFSDDIFEIFAVCFLYSLCVIIPCISLYYYLFLCEKKPMRFYENGIEIFKKKKKPIYREYSEYIAVLIKGKKNKRYHLRSRFGFNNEIKLQMEDPGVKQNMKKIKAAIKRFSKGEGPKRRRHHKKRVPKPITEVHPRFGKFLFEDREFDYKQRIRVMRKTQIIAPLVCLEIAGLFILLTLHNRGLYWTAIFGTTLSFGIMAGAIVLASAIQIGQQKKVKMYSKGIVIQTRKGEVLIPFSKFRTIDYDIAHNPPNWVRMSHTRNLVTYTISMKDPKARRHMPYVESKVLTTNKK